MKTSKSETESATNESEWVKTPIANLVRNKASGKFFARCRIKGKLFRQSLKTTTMSVAKLRLADFVKTKQEELGDLTSIESGKMTVADALKVFRQRLDARADCKEGAKVYRHKCIDVLLRSWPELESKPVGKISNDECVTWAKRFKEKYSATVFNNVVSTLQMILDIPVARLGGVRMDAEEMFLRQAEARGTAHVRGLSQFVHSIWHDEPRLNRFYIRLGRALAATSKRKRTPDWHHGVDKSERLIVESWVTSIIVDGERWPELCYFTHPALQEFLSLCKPSLAKKARHRTDGDAFRQKIQRLGLVSVRTSKIKNVEKRGGKLLFA